MEDNRTRPVDAGLTYPEFADPRLVAIYDTMNPIAEHETFYLELAAIRRALKPSGHLAFERRNPLVQPWLDANAEAHIDWPSQASRREVNDPVAGPIERGDR